MFSPSELLSFVFANENDVYYGEDLLKLNLNQYLWRKLHENYETVYFLHASDNGFSVKSFGDLSCKPYDPGPRSFFGLAKKQNNLGAWIQRQLCANPSHAVAFVCPMKDFCAVLEDDRWTSVLQNIATAQRRTGIFVLTASATAEHTQKLLLHSPVFDRLHETAVTDVRGGQIQELYGPIKRRKWDSCLFLNTFTWDRVRNLLLHIAMEQPSRCISCKQLDSLAEYLTDYLNDPRLQRAQPLFGGLLPSSYLLYRDLYEQLRDERVWSRLVQQSGLDAQSRQHGRILDHSTEVCHGTPVLRDLKCYAGKCMMLRLPGWFHEYNADDTRVLRTLESIQCEVSAPKNRPENQQIVSAVEEFLKLVDKVYVGDIETYKQILFAVEFCVKWVYAEPESKHYSNILKIIENLQNHITNSSTRFALCRDLTYNQHYYAGSLHDRKLSQIERECEKYEKICKLQLDLIHASILELTMPSSASNIMDQLDRLTQGVLDCQEQPADVVETTSQEDGIEEDFTLRPEDYVFNPLYYINNRNG